MANEPDELSVDDALERTRVASQNPATSIQGLPGDGQRPAAPASDPITPRLPEDHPLKDSNIDPAEAYDVGKDALTELPDNSEGKESL